MCTILLFTVCMFYCIIWHKTIFDIIQYERQTRDGQGSPYLGLSFDLFICLLFSVL